jgi:hypothetical protein
MKGLRSVKSVGLMSLFFLLAAVLQPFQTAHAQLPLITDPQRRFKVSNPQRASTRSAFNPPISAESFLTVARHINGALTQAGYGEQSWYLVSLDEHHINGFAVMTRLERIDSDGRPINDNRFSQDFYRPHATSLLQLLKAALVALPSGRYRAFAFYVTLEAEEAPRKPDMPGSLEIANSLFVSGARTPMTFPILNSIRRNYTCVAYVYEFQRSSSDQPPQFVTNSSQTALQHLQAAGLGTPFGLN